MRTLKKRPRADTLVSEKRRNTNLTGRMIYLALLALFAVSVLNYLFGDFVFLRADGLVLRDRNTIAAGYVARVEEVSIAEAQKVKKGDVLLRLQSAELLERLADLSTQRAQLAASHVEYTTRIAIVSRLLPLARKRETQAAKTVTEFEKLAKTGLSTFSGYDAALNASYKAQEDHVRLSTEDQTLKKELIVLESARNEADAALENLKRHYGDGIVRASVDGEIGASVPSVGSVFRAGDDILTIYSGEVYVLAYLPRRYLFPVYEGMDVVVSDGRQQVKGILSEMLPVTDALPKEFQNTFKPRDRSQLAKIKFSSPSTFLLHDKVSISGGFELFPIF